MKTQGPDRLIRKDTYLNTLLPFIISSFSTNAPRVFCVETWNTRGVFVHSILLCH